MQKKKMPEVLVRSMMCPLREQRQESGWILSCKRSLRIMWGCTNDLCCQFFLQSS